MALAEEGGGGEMPDERELVRLLGTRFIQRKTVKAFQKPDGAWYPVRESFTMSDFRNHLAGSQTVGHYLLDDDGLCKLFAFDIDFVKHNRDCADRNCKGCPVTVTDTDGTAYEVEPRKVWMQEHPASVVLTREIRILAEGLARRINTDLQIPVAIATSGNKGLHVYGFTGSLPADASRQLAHTVLTKRNCFEPYRGDNFYRHISAFNSVDIEVFPKQSTLDGKELGNLMKLPLGIHKVSGRRSEFISCRSQAGTLMPMDPFRALEGDLPWE